MNSQRVHKEIKEELLEINNILSFISEELNDLKNMTYPSGEISKLLRENAITMKSLAKLGKIDIDLSESLMGAGATQSMMETQMSHLLHDTFRENTFN